MPTTDWVAPVLSIVGAVAANYVTEQVKAWNVAKAEAKKVAKEEETAKRVAWSALESDRDGWKEKYFALYEKHLAQEEQDLKDAKDLKEKS